MATLSNILAWEILWTEPDGLQDTLGGCNLETDQKGSPRKDDDSVGAGW